MEIDPATFTCYRCDVCSYAVWRQALGRPVCDGCNHQLFMTDEAARSDWQQRQKQLRVVMDRVTYAQPPIGLPVTAAALAAYEALRPLDAPEPPEPFSPEWQAWLLEHLLEDEPLKLDADSPAYAAAVAVERAAEAELGLSGIWPWTWPLRNLFKGGGRT